MKTSKKSVVLSSVQYIIIFIGFALSYMFTYPQYDVLLFTRDFKGDIVSVLREALFYGNGRFFGNVFGFYFSHHFTAAIFFTAFFLTLIVFLANKLFFNDNPKAIFPIGTVIAFHAVPFAFSLMSGVFIKKLKVGGSRFLYVPLAFSAVCTCLFSENTTIVVLCAAIMIIVGDIINNKKASVPGIVNMIFSAVGALMMYLIPRVTYTKEKLDYYRGYVEPKALIFNITSTLRSFALLANQYFIIYVILSGAMIYVLYRQCKTNRFIKFILTAILTVFPLTCIFAVIFAQKVNELAMIYLPLEVVYLIAALVVSVLSKQKKLITSLIMTVVLLGSAVAPMTIVNHRGDRTFFTTFAILFCYAMYLIKSLDMGKKIKQLITAAAPVAFVAGCCIMLVLTAQNFDSYVYRADYLAQESVTSSNADVPYLAHGRLAQETTLGQIDPCLFGSSVDMSFNVIPTDEWEKADEYKKITSLTPADAVKYGLEHWEFKDATYPLKLHEKYVQSR